MTAPQARRPGQGGWVRRYHRPRRRGPVVVCLPHAGGSASAYFALSEALSGMAEVLIVQYPGRQDRIAEPPLTDLRELADRAAEALAPELDGPPVLFGHSMGAVLAYEVALRMERRPGAGPQGLIVSGRVAPSFRHDRGVRLLDDAGIARKMTELAGTPPEVLADAELLATVLPALRADFTAVETYRGDPGAGLAAPISAYTGDADPDVPPGELLAWREHTTSRFRTETFEGGHFYLRDAPPAFLRAFSRDLAGFGAAAVPGEAR